MSDLDYTPGPDDAYFADMWALELEAQRVGREDRLAERGGLTEAERQRRLDEMPGRGEPSAAPQAPASVSPPVREAA